MIHDINKDTKLCMSLSGRPGNFGTRFHNYLYRELKLNFIYKAFTTSDIRAAIEGIRALEIRGCAISMPFKEICIEYLNEMDPSAQGIMSVNTIVNTGGHLKGYNTDYAAVYYLLNFYQGPIQSRFIVLGSGGMAKAVVCALKNAGFKNGIVISRNTRSGPALAAQYGFEYQPQLGALSAELIINVTPIGMAGGEESQNLSFPASTINAAQVVFDVVALPAETPLILKARSLGKKVITGVEVIALQAVEQFFLYTGIRPNQDLIDQASSFARLPS